MRVFRLPTRTYGVRWSGVRIHPPWNTCFSPRYMAGILVDTVQGEPLTPELSNSSLSFSCSSSDDASSVEMMNEEMKGNNEHTSAALFSGKKRAKRPSYWSVSAEADKNTQRDLLSSSGSMTGMTFVPSRTKRQLPQQQELHPRTASSHVPTLGWVHRMKVMIQTGTCSPLGVEEVARWCLAQERKHLYAFYKPFAPLNDHHAPHLARRGSTASFPSPPQTVAASPEDFLRLLRLLSDERNTIRKQQQAFHPAPVPVPSHLPEGDTYAAAAVGSSFSDVSDTCLGTLAVQVARLFFDLLNKPAHPQRSVPSKWDASAEAHVAVRMKVEVVQWMVKRVLQGEEALQWLAEILGIPKRGGALPDRGHAERERTCREEEVAESMWMGVEDDVWTASSSSSFSPLSASSLVYQTLLDLYEWRSSTGSEKGHSTSGRRKAELRHQKLSRQRELALNAEQGERATPTSFAFALKDPHGELVLRSSATVAVIVSTLLQIGTPSGRAAALHLLEVIATPAASSTFFSPFFASSPVPCSSTSVLPMETWISGHVLHVFTSCAEVAAESGDAEMVTRLLFLLYRLQGVLGLESLRFLSHGEHSSTDMGTRITGTHPHVRSSSRGLRFFSWWPNTVHWIMEVCARWGSTVMRRGQTSLRNVFHHSYSARGGVAEEVRGIIRTLASSWKTFYRRKRLIPVMVGKRPSSLEAQRNQWELLEIATTRLLKSAMHASLLLPSPIMETPSYVYGIPRAPCTLLDRRPQLLALEKLEESFRLFSSLEPSVTWSGVAAMGVELLIAAATTQQACYRCWQGIAPLLYHECQIGCQKGKRDAARSLRHRRASSNTRLSCPAPAGALREDMERIGHIAVGVLHVLCGRLPSRGNEGNPERRSIGQHHILVACAELVCRCLTGVAVVKESPYRPREEHRKTKRKGETWHPGGLHKAGGLLSSSSSTSMEEKRLIEFPVVCLPFPVPRWSENDSGTSVLERRKTREKGKTFNTNGMQMKSTSHSSAAISSDRISRHGDGALQPIPLYIQDLFAFLLREDTEEAAQAQGRGERERLHYPASLLPTPYSTEVPRSFHPDVSPLSSLLVYALLAFTEGQKCGVSPSTSSWTAWTEGPRRGAPKAGHAMGTAVAPSLLCTGQGPRVTDVDACWGSLPKRGARSPFFLPTFVTAFTGRSDAAPSPAKRDGGEATSYSAAKAEGPRSNTFSSSSSSVPETDALQDSFLQRLLDQCDRVPHHPSFGSFSSSLAAFFSMWRSELGAFLSSPFSSTTAATQGLRVVETPDLVGGLLLYGSLCDVAMGGLCRPCPEAGVNASGVSSLGSDSMRSSCSSPLPGCSSSSASLPIWWMEWFFSSHPSCRFFFWHVLLHQDPLLLSISVRPRVVDENPVAPSPHDPLSASTPSRLGWSRWKMEALCSALYRTLHVASTPCGRFRRESQEWSTEKEKQRGATVPPLSSQRVAHHGFLRPFSHLHGESEASLYSAAALMNVGRGAQDRERENGLAMMGREEVSLCLATLYHFGVPPEKDLLQVLNECWHRLWICASRDHPRLMEASTCMCVTEGERPPHYTRGLSEILKGEDQKWDGAAPSSGASAVPPHVVVVVTRSTLGLLLSSAVALPKLKRSPSAGGSRSTCTLPSTPPTTARTSHWSSCTTASSSRFPAAGATSLDAMVRLIEMLWLQEREGGEGWCGTAPSAPVPTVVQLVLTPECAYDLLTLFSDTGVPSTPLPSGILELQKVLQSSSARTTSSACYPTSGPLATPFNATLSPPMARIDTPSSSTGVRYSVCVTPPLDPFSHHGRGGHLGPHLYHRFHSSPFSSSFIPLQFLQDTEGVAEAMQFAVEAREKCPLENRPLVLLWREYPAVWQWREGYGVPSPNTPDHASLTKETSYFPSLTRGKKVLGGRLSSPLIEPEEETEVEVFGPGWRPCDGVRLLSVQRAKRIMAKAAIRAACHALSGAPPPSSSVSLASSSIQPSRSWLSCFRNDALTHQTEIPKKEWRNSPLKRSRVEETEARRVSGEFKGFSQPFARAWKRKKQCTPSEPLLKVLGVPTKKSKP